MRPGPSRLLRLLRRLPRPVRFFLINFYYRWSTGGRPGRYVAWGGGRRLDVQIGSPRDLALERAEKSRAAADRAWAAACARSVR